MVKYIGRFSGKSAIHGLHQLPTGRLCVIFFSGRTARCDPPMDPMVKVDGAAASQHRVLLLGRGFKELLYFHPYLWKIPILTNIFQLGRNHHL